MSALPGDYHVHTTWSDGTGSVEECVARAVDLGLPELGIADHVSPDPLPGEDWWVPLERLGDYLADVRAAAERHDDITVLAGLEAEFVVGREAELDRLLDAYPWDCVVLGVHVVDGFVFDDPGLRRDARWTRPDELLAAYYRTMRRAAEYGRGDILAHFDYISLWGHEPGAAVLPEIEAALDALAASGLALELNSDRISDPAGVMYPSREILRMACERGIPLVIDSDAHEAEHVGRLWDEAVEHAAAAGYRETLRISDRTPGAAAGTVRRGRPGVSGRHGRAGPAASRRDAPRRGGVRRSGVDALVHAARARGGAHGAGVGGGRGGVGSPQRSSRSRRDARARGRRPLLDASGDARRDAHRRRPRPASRRGRVRAVLRRHGCGHPAPVPIGVQVGGGLRGGAAHRAAACSPPRRRSPTSCPSWPAAGTTAPRCGTCSTCRWACASTRSTRTTTRTSPASTGSTASGPGGTTTSRGPRTRSPRRRRASASTDGCSTTSRSTCRCSAGSWSARPAVACPTSSRTSCGVGLAASTRRTSPWTPPAPPSWRAASAPACATLRASGCCSAAVARAPADASCRRRSWPTRAQRRP